MDEHASSAIETESAVKNEAGAPALQELKLDSGVFYRRWDVASPRAAVLLVHGLGEHSGRYQHVAESLAARQIMVVAPDHPGHGLSPGQRSHIDSFADYFAALDEISQQLREEFPALPKFIVGHSLGGLITGNYLLDRQSHFAGAAFSGAAFEVSEPPAAIAVFINRILAAIMPKLGVMQLDASEVSRDPDVVQRYIDDPLVHSGKISARLVVELFTAMENLQTRRAALELPILVMHGDGDVMTAVEGSKHFHDGVSSEDKTLRFYPGLYHEIFNEPEQAQVLGELGDWLDAHIPSV